MRCLLVLMLLAVGGLASGQDDYDDEDEGPLFLPGLVAEYTGSDGHTHQRVDDVLSMNWGASSPDLRVPKGSFKARWSSLLQIWTTGEYRFRIYLVGKARLKLGDQIVIEGTRTEAAWLESEVVEIEWGEQELEVDFEKVGEQAQIALFWQGPDFDWEPVSTHSLLYSTEHSPDNRFQHGRFLARALRCAACHEVADHQQRISAPSLDKFNGAISPDWIVDWLMEKPSEDPSTTDEALSRRMPHFSLSRQDAEAIAAALTADDSPKKLSLKKPNGVSEAGRLLFLSTGCTSCHRIGELGESGLFGGGDLSKIAEKRPPGFFIEWLKNPKKLNHDHRMPVFALSDDERGHLAAYLSTLGSEYKSSDFVTTDVSLIDLGKSLIKEHRCQKCHRLREELKQKDQSLISLNLQNANWNGSCTVSEGKNRPLYGLAVEQQDAIRAYFMQLPVKRSVEEEKLDGKFLMRERNCLGCHSRGGVQGLEKQIQAIATAEHALNRKMGNLKPPALDSIGDKLHDKILLDAITTQRPARRSWLSVRMPKFNFSEGEAEAIADYLIQGDRIPAPPEQEELSIEELALQSAGARLVTTDGFGCTSCHQIGDLNPTHTGQGVRGPNLAQIGKEVRYPWFLRWVLNPTRISPRMEMPAVKTPIRGVLDSRLDHQHAAVWAVLNQEGFEPPKPNPVRVIRQRNESDKKKAAIVVIDNVEVGKQSYVKPLLVALTNRHNVLFDLESYRLAGWWLGDAARQRLRKKYWYWEGAGSEILPASTGMSEVSLELNGQRLYPTIDPAFPPEAIERRTLGADWSFKSQVSFTTEEHKTETIQIKQTLKPFGGDEESSTFSGFRRVVEFSRAPSNTNIVLDVAPEAAMLIAGNGQSAREIDEHRFEVAVVDEAVNLEAVDNSTVVRLKPDSRGNASIELEYRTLLPVDRYLQESPDPALVEQEKLHVVPGFDVSRLPLAEEITPTAFAWDQDGKLLLTTLKGRLWRASDTDEDQIEDSVDLLFDGLSAPFGLATIKENGTEAIDVADKTALLRLSDTDDDGQLDRTRTVASGWGNSTDYHGWVVGLPRDKSGNYYALITNRDGPPTQLRGRVMKLAKLNEPTSAGLEYQVQPLAMGLRFSLGIARNQAGELFFTDNQGQYNPYNELNHVVEGNHYGFYNLSGLDDTPETKAMPKTGPTVGIPHPWVRSVNGICFLETPAQLFEATGKKIFGPFEGHMLGCEATTRQLVRISLQKVDGRFNGAAYPLTIPPQRGASSLLRPLVAQIAPDGAVYVGSVHDSAWGAGRNMGEVVKMQYNDKLPTGIAEMRIVDNGFELEFTNPVDRVKAVDLTNYVLVSYRRVPTPAYGGPDVDRRTEKIESAEITEDGLQVVLKLPEMRTGFVYELRLRNLTSSGELFHPAEAFYSLGPLE